MKREKMIEQIKESPHQWDVIIVGGGATGLGAAVEAASRGYKTLLLEQADFAKGTSSRSTKLIHGGLRYLQQGNITLVREALKERGILCKNAPHLIHHLPFLVPNYHWWEGPFYGAGLKIYDVLAGKLGIEKSRHLSRQQTLRALPTLEKKDLRGGVIYYDGQFDDARLAICLARTAVDCGATVINYMKVSNLIKKRGTCIGVKATDCETGEHHVLQGKAIINATGIFADNLVQRDNSKAASLISPSQGIHLVLDRSFLPGKTAILVPHTSDGRVLFMVPWHNRILLGTTDTPRKKVTLEPHPLAEEIDFLLEHAGRYLTRHPTRSDILSIFAGLRPLVKSARGKNTAALSRDHSIFISSSGLITIAGGKWTTYRKMGEDVVDKAMSVGNLPKRNSVTSTLPLHGYAEGLDPSDHWSTYGSDLPRVKKTGKERRGLQQKIDPRLPYTQAELLWAIRHEMARTVEDLLARRTRSLLLNAKASLSAAPLTAQLLAEELNRSESWAKKQVHAYNKVAQHYFS
jgi:glycerol-3-phosphate dehydrogenase